MDEYKEAFISIDQAIAAAANGQLQILIGDTGVRTRAVLSAPAQMTTPDIINFMARYGRGLICLALTPERCNALGLQPIDGKMGPDVQTRFMVSIEAVNGVSTGISAADRALTIAAAINSANPRGELVSPGHVFPVEARAGGSLVKAGAAEAAIDLSRLAGLNPSAVYCEILGPDGALATQNELLELADLHGLNLVSISDLITYRSLNDRIVACVQDRAITLDDGTRWRLCAYTDQVGYERHVLLQMGTIDTSRPTLVRMHPVSLLGDVLRTGARRGLLQLAIDAIRQEGTGIIVMLGASAADDPAHLESTRLPSSLPPNYGIGAQMLIDVGVREMILLSSRRYLKAAELKGHGLSIVGERSLLPAIVENKAGRV